jgi:hypothetical protein
MGERVTWGTNLSLFYRQKWVSQPRTIQGFGPGGEMTVELSFQDNPRNGHNTFRATAEVATAESRRRNDVAACGMMHDEIRATFPELSHLLKWHGVSTDGPCHYLANAIYLASDRDHKGKQRDLDGARRAAVWPDATDGDLMAEPASLKVALMARLPALLEEFKHDILAAGFLWSQ